MAITLKDKNMIGVWQTSGKNHFKMLQGIYAEVNFHEASPGLQKRWHNKYTVEVVVRCIDDISRNKAPFKFFDNAVEATQFADRLLERYAKGAKRYQERRNKWFNMDKIF